MLYNYLHQMQNNRAQELSNRLRSYAKNQSIDAKRTSLVLHILEHSYSAYEENHKLVECLHTADHNGYIEITNLFQYSTKKYAKDMTVVINLADNRAYIKIGEYVAPSALFTRLLDNNFLHLKFSGAYTNFNNTKVKVSEIKFIVYMLHILTTAREPLYDLELAFFDDYMRQGEKDTVTSSDGKHLMRGTRGTTSTRGREVGTKGREVLIDISAPDSYECTRLDEITSLIVYENKQFIMNARPITENSEASAESNKTAVTLNIDLQALNRAQYESPINREAYREAHYIEVLIDRLYAYAMRLDTFSLDNARTLYETLITSASSKYRDELAKIPQLLDRIPSITKRELERHLTDLTDLQGQPSNLEELPNSFPTTIQALIRHIEVVLYDAEHFNCSDVTIGQYNDWLDQLRRYSKQNVEALGYYKDFSMRRDSLTGILRSYSSFSDSEDFTPTGRKGTFKGDSTKDSTRISARHFNYASIPILVQSEPAQYELAKTA